MTGAVATDYGTGDLTADYVHRDKFATPREGIAVGNSKFKWSNIALPEAPVPIGIETLARTFMKTVNVAGDLGFVTLHRCGDNFYFLLVSTWRNRQELWESVYAKSGAEEPQFKTFLYDKLHRGTYCVWELGVVWHEQNAYKRLLVSERSDKDVMRYLDDVYEGPV